MFLKSITSPRGRLAAAAALTGAVVLAVGVADLGRAANAPGALYTPLDLTCTMTLPTVGTKTANAPIPIRITFPPSVAVGQAIEARMAVTYTVLSNGASLADATAKYGVSSIAMNAAFHGSWSGAATGPVDGMVTQTLTPPATGDWPLNIGAALKGMATSAGTATFNLNKTKAVEFVGTPLMADGQPSAVGNLAGSCDLATSQSPDIFTVEVV